MRVDPDPQDVLRVRRAEPETRDTGAHAIVRGGSHPERLREAIRREAAAGVAPATLALAVTYVVFTVSHHYVLPPPIARVMVPLTAGEVLAYLALYIWAVRYGVAPAQAHPALAIVAGLAILNSLTLLFLIDDPEQTTNLYLLAIGAGFLMLETPWFAGTAAVLIAGFAIEVARRPAAPEWTHFGFGMLSALVLAVVIHIVRVRSVVRVHTVDRLRVQDEFKTQFINTTAHELATALTPIKLHLAMLEKAQEPAARERSLDVIKRNFERLVRMVQDMLETTRLRGRRIEIQRAPVDVARLLRETAESFMPSAAHTGVTMRVDAPPELVANADAQRVHQVVSNLVSNALKFTPAGGRVTLHTHAGREGVTVLVHDTGVGIAPEEADLLFEPFRQLQAGEERGGTGLGLHISKQIVELHGGAIWCESEGRERGATFGFSLPTR